MRVPILPTVIVAAAIATMIALGFWQLDRMGEKEALIARAEQALAIEEQVRFPATSEEREALLYRRTTVPCDRVEGVTTTAGRSARNVSGVAHRATCRLGGAETVSVDLGFSRDPAPVDWAGGEVTGIIAPGDRIVAIEPVAGLQPLATPDPRDLPNNHLAYAGQWFFFALTALVVYVLALRRGGTHSRDD